MKRIVTIFATAGLVVPIILTITVRLEAYFNQEDIPRSLTYGRYLWPSSFWLLLTNLPGDNAFSDSIVWVLSILVNIAVYTLTGLIVGSVSFLFARRKPDDAH